MLLCKVGMNCGEDGLEIRGYLVCCGVSDCFEVGLISGSGEETGCDLKVFGGISSHSSCIWRPPFYVGCL